MQHLAEAKNSKAAVEEAVNGLAWAHSLAGVPSPTDLPIVRSTLGGLRRKLAKPVIKKAPFSVAMLQAIVHDAQLRNTLASLRLASACLLSFAGFLRFDELANLQCCDISIGQHHMTLQITHSKTDQLRQGNKVVIVRTPATTCPVAMLEAYISRGDIHLSSSLKLFRPNVSGHVEKLRNTGALSYTRMRELVKEKLDELGFQAVEFGLHSGGCNSSSGSRSAG